MITGPGRPERARVKARRNTSGTRSGEGILKVHFATVWNDIEVRHFLQHSFGELLTRAVAEDDDKRDAVSEGIDDSCHGIAPSWSFCHHRHPWLAAAAGVTVGHENGGLFVARENQWNIILLMKRIEQRKDVVTRQRRDEFNSL